MLGGQQGLERMSEHHGPALHPGKSFSPFVLSSPSLYLSFFQLKPVALCPVHEELEPTGLFSSQLYLETYCFQTSLREMNPISTVVFHLSYFLAFLSCLVLNSPVAPHLSSATNLSCCSSRFLPTLRRDQGYLNTSNSCWCCCLS